MDVADLEKQLADVDALLAGDPGNGGYAALRATLVEALELARGGSEDEDEEEEEEEDGVDREQVAEAATASQVRADPATTVESLPGRALAEPLRSSVPASAEETLEQVIEGLPRGLQANAASATEASRKRSARSLDDILLGARCEAYDNGLNVWQGAVLEAYENERGLATVQLLHDSSEKLLAASCVRPIKGKAAYERSKLRIGLRCNARFSGDEKWYPALVMSVTPHGCVVQYSMYKSQEQVAFEHLEPDFETAPDASGSIAVAEVPRHLQVRDGDSEAVKRRKLGTLNKLKKQTRQAQKELVLEDKKQGWQAFQAKGVGKKKKRSKDII